MKQGRSEQHSSKKVYLCNMKKILLLFIYTLIIFDIHHGQVLQDSIWSNSIKTVTLYKNNIDQEAPIITLNKKDRLMLRFDEISEQPTNYRYRIIHCNSTWQADSLEPYEYIQGAEDGYIENYNSSFTTLTSYINYFQPIPNEYSEFTTSGNYALEVFLDEDPDSIVITRRFYVTENIFNVDIEVTSPTENKWQNQEVNITINNNNPAQSHLLNSKYLKVVLQQNGRSDNKRILSLSGHSSNKLYYRWHKENIFEGGNTFRYFDISNIRTPMYNVTKIEHYGSEIYAILMPEENRSRKNYETIISLNGGMKTNAWDRNDPLTESEYVYVNFLLPMEQPLLNGTIHIVGELTNWHLNENSKMEYNSQIKAYTKRMLLKQGYYSYQLLFKEVGTEFGITGKLEGNHTVTPNTYTAYIYYRMAGDRYERLIAVEQQKPTISK